MFNFPLENCRMSNLPGQQDLRRPPNWAEMHDRCSTLVYDRKCGQYYRFLRSVKAFLLPPSSFSILVLLEQLLEQQQTENCDSWRIFWNGYVPANSDEEDEKEDEEEKDEESEEQNSNGQKKRESAKNNFSLKLISFLPLRVPNTAPGTLLGTVICEQTYKTQTLLYLPPPTK